MIKIKKWFIKLFKKKYSYNICDDFQENVSKNTICLIGYESNFDFLEMKCPCGCNELIKLSLVEFDKPHWKVKFFNDRISVSPSIWRNKGCKSHFFVKNSKIIWVKNKSHFSLKGLINKFFRGI
ncbi:MAG: hypothetical protein IPM32_09225 [Ignavibacteriae bacterium]|nr:hypothetical protein [Ignavibacteriota bacterium]